MRYISLFSGIEAASVAWGPLGWEPVAFSEIEPLPCAVLAERFPDVPNLGDITNVDWRPYRGAVDIVVGGSPCQSFSIAGNREGLRGESGLMFEYIRAVREVLPRYFVWENVPGALSSEGGAAFGQLLREMDDLGYGLAWRVLDAQFFGVAQRRRRLFLVGCLGDVERAAEILFERESLRWDHPSSRDKRKELAAGSERRARGSYMLQVRCGDSRGGGNGALVQEDVSATLSTSNMQTVFQPTDNCLTPWDTQSSRVYFADGAFATLSAGSNGGMNRQAVCYPVVMQPSGSICFQQNQRDEVRLIGGDGQVAGALSASSGMKNTNYVLTQYGEEVAGTLTARDSSPCSDRGQNVVCIASTQANAEIDDELCGTLTRRSYKDAPVIFEEDSFASETGYTVRRLMPVECERLQGFPDGWTDVGLNGKPASDTARYKALGNSMAVPVMRWIGERISASEGAAA